MKAIILAGGQGSRLRPLTDHIPKALVPIGGTTLIEQVINSLPDSVDTVIITTKYLGHLIEEKITNNYNHKKVLYTAQPVDSDGTLAAVLSAKQYVEDNELFAVLNCDDLFNKEELSVVFDIKKIGMGITPTTMPAKYHGMQVSEDGYVIGFNRHTDVERELPIHDVFANGIYILDSKVFSMTPVALSDGELGLPHTLLANINTYPLFGHSIATWQPCNSFEDLDTIKKTL